MSVAIDTRLRTQMQIVERLGSLSLSQWRREVLIDALEFNCAREFLQPCEFEHAAAWWDEQRDLYTYENTLAVLKRSIVGYAWPTSLNHNWQGNQRVVDKCVERVWLLGNDDLLTRVEATPYPKFGAPKLALICVEYGFEIPDDDRIAHMIAGNPCSDFCRKGC